MAGYSGTPLPQKLGIKPGHRVALLNAPDGFDDTSVRHSLTATAPLDVIVAFHTQRAELASQLALMRRCMTQAGGLWIAWPKRTSKVPTDITEDVVREIALPTGLVDNKVCAIDTSWSMACLQEDAQRLAWPPLLPPQRPHRSESSAI